jgi:indole-3-glycerol phosphate synthase
MNILPKIISNKRKEIELLKKGSAHTAFENSSNFSRKTFSLSGFLLESKRSGIIAEFKRISPSGGILNPQADVKYVTKGYSGSGASGISILTDSLFFGGSCKDIEEVRHLTDIPILRKDFIIDEIQILESKASGADAVLLIASVLRKEEILSLARLARSIGLEVLLEVHEEKELEHFNEFVSLIGVNNRNLDTLKTDVRLSEELADKMPAGIVRISESGISDPQTVIKLRNAGYNGFLIGEHFMRNPDPVLSFKDFVNGIML